MELTSALQRQKTVVFTLFLRELGVRFGRFRLGYIWAILEPVAFISILSFVRMQWGRGPVAGVDYPVFFASGILAYLVFTHIANSSLTAIENNQGLFNYRQVKPFDSVLSRALLELGISVASAIVIFSGLKYLGFQFHWNNTLGVITTVALLFLLSLGFGLIASILGPLFNDAKKVIPLLIRPLFFISGIFFAADQIPEPYRTYLLLNPLLHVTELIRENMFVEFQSRGGSFAYLSGWTLVMLFAGLLVYRKYRIKILTSGNIK
jgi:capsular polysaccharide transport system permease protein